MTITTTETTTTTVANVSSGHQEIPPTNTDETTTHDTSVNYSISNNRQNNGITNYDTQIIYTTPSKYGAIIVVLLLFPPLAPFGIIIPLQLSSSDASKGDLISSYVQFGVILLLIMIIYLIFLPQRLQVISDGTLEVLCVLRTWRFSNIIAVHDNHSICNDCGCKRKIDFTTCFSQRVLLQRSDGGWEVVVSPKQSTEFLNALSQVIPSMTSEVTTDEQNV